MARKHEKGVILLLGTMLGACGSDASFCVETRSCESSAEPDAGEIEGDDAGSAGSASLDPTGGNGAIEPESGTGGARSVAPEASGGTGGEPLPVPASGGTDAGPDPIDDTDGGTDAGCEANLNDDPAHCGACSFACAGSLGCMMGACEQAVEEVGIGYGFACARKPAAAGGSVLCWGNNQYAMLGPSAGDEALEPTAVPEVGRVRDLSVGVIHSCAVDAMSDSVVCWGKNSAHALGSSDLEANFFKRAVPGVIQVAASHAATCALTNQGDVSCWGDGSRGQIGPTASEAQSWRTSISVDRDAVAIDAGWAYFCALTDSSSVRCWGSLTGTVEEPHLLENEDGSIVRDARAVSVGYSHLCVLRNDGRVACAGSNGYGEVGDGTFDYSTPAIRPLRDVPGLSDVVQIVAGSQMTCAVASNGSVYCWGRGDLGQLGLGPGAGELLPDGQTRIVTTPTRLDDLPPVLEVHSGAVSTSTCVRLQTGAIRCFGYNQYGEVGDGTKVQRLTPVDVKGLF